MKKIAVFCAGLIGLACVAEAGVLGEIAETVGWQKANLQTAPASQANAIEDMAADLAIMAMSYDRGMGRDITLAESKNLSAEIMDLELKVCNVDMHSTLLGVVTITFGESCVTSEGIEMDVPTVMKLIQESNSHRATCSKSICVLDFRKPK